MEVLVGSLLAIVVAAVDVLVTDADVRADSVGDGAAEGIWAAVVMTVSGCAMSVLGEGFVAVDLPGGMIQLRIPMVTTSTADKANARRIQ